MTPELCVLHVTPYSGDAWAYGGIPRLSQAMARSLAGRGHRVTICTTDACDWTRRLEAGAAGATRFSPWAPFESQQGVTLRVFPNLSNRLAYHQQAFLADRTACVPPRARTGIRRGPSACLPESARRDRVAMPARGRRPLRAGAQRDRPQHREPAVRQADLRCRPSGDDVTRHASRVLATTEAERRQLQRAGRGGRAHPTGAQPDRSPGVRRRRRAQAASRPASGSPARWWRSSARSRRASGWTI